MKNKIRSLILVSLLFAIAPVAKSQVLISLLLGDKLNTGKIEFGMDGGVNLLRMSNTPDAKSLNDWNLGFYFNFVTKNPKLFIITGVLVKSKMGASGIQPYSLNNKNLDSAFIGGTVDRKINYFNVPVMLRYRFIDYFHVEGGIQLGLRYTGFDIFSNEVYSKDDLEFKNDIKDNFTRLDAGGVIGIGYKSLKGEGMTYILRYYQGLVDVNTALEGSQANSAFYASLAIPIGKNKAAKKRAEKELENK
jgi:hypothetical protein